MGFFSSDPTPVVVFSGGQEIVSIAIIEELSSYNVPLIVIALGRKSLLSGLQPVKAFCRIEWPPVSTEMTINQITTFLQNQGANQENRLPVYATEDTGLRFIFENRFRLDNFLHISDSSPLISGGLDKAELFSHLNKKQGLSDCIASTVVLERPEDLLAVADQIGIDIVVKPALKPLSGELNLKNGSKILTPSSDEPQDIFLNNLRESWPISSRWIAQKKLKYDNEGEAVWWGVRLTSGDIIGATAFDYRFYPRNGGTAYWVGMKEVTGLEEKAGRILEACGLTGIFEVEFLLDDDQDWKMVEINPRPWLQAALPTRAGLPLIYYSYCDKLGIELPTRTKINSNATWVNIERLLLSVASSEYNSRISGLSSAMSIILKADCVTVYDSKFHMIKIRYIFRMFQALLRKVFKFASEIGKHRRGVFTKDKSPTLN